MTIQNKLNTALAALSFVFVGIPLGIKVSRRETSANLGVAVAIALGYYFLTVMAGWLDNRPELRPDLLLTEEGFVMTELDSVPGGIGLTAFLNRLYGGEEPGSAILGAGDLMVGNFYAALAALRPGTANPLVALVVSDEASTYRPEMEWLAHQLQLRGRRVFCLRPGNVFPLGGALFFDSGGNPERIDIIYRFFELFDLPNIPAARHIFEAWAAGEVAP